MQTGQEQLINDWGVKELQEKLLEGLLYIDEFCKEHAVEYVLAYGSVLGAWRHGGFIPWDDDVDICMTVQDYRKFKEIFLEKGDHEKYHLQELGGIDGMCIMPKFRMNGTTFIEESYRNRDIHQGIFIDIFLYHGVPPTDIAKKKAIRAIKYITIKKLSNNHYARRKNYLPLLALLRLFPRNFLLKYSLKQIYKFDWKETEDLFDTENPPAKMFYRKDIIFPTRRVNFEGHELCLPNQIEKYLSAKYGDWQKLPDLESIKWAQHSSLWRTDEDFRKHVPNVKDYSDESAL
jgi:lipopolysaccharide cholinephosphotransferase